MAEPRRRPLQEEPLVRVVVSLSLSVVEALDSIATREGQSRSGLVRVLLIRHLREKGEQE